MSEKGLSSQVFRRIFTIILLAGISITFLAVYYFVYLPQQRALFNSRTFRILHQIAVNFQQRIENYDSVKMYNYISTNYNDNAIPVSDLHLVNPATPNGVEKNKFDSIFKASFDRAVSIKDSLHADVALESDSVRYDIYKTKGRLNTTLDTKKQSLSEILSPLTSAYSGTFQSVFLIQQIIDSANKKSSQYDKILYRPKESDIDIANINTDSLFSDKNFQVPAVRDVKIEDVPYRIFLLPFKMPSYNTTFILTGIMKQDTYDQQVQNIPIMFLLSVIFILVTLLLALPFLKIFFLNNEESIQLHDIRAMVAVVFIIPFFLCLLYAGIWIYRYENTFINDTLASMQNSIKNNFYTEIKQCIQQEKDYDKIIANPDTVINSALYKKLVDSAGNFKKNITGFDIKNVIFHPQVYKNFTSIHWINKNGNDIAAWNLTNDPATYFNLNDRTYFQDIKYNKGYNFPPDTCAFSIQPILSRLTGDYTISVSKHSSAKLKDTVVASVIGISGKMYSIYNTVVPNGFAFCIIDSAGSVVCHSDEARNLQENIFRESINNDALVNAIRHKDSVEINDVILYEHPVKMIVKPLPGLPYYLITYHQQRNEYLFIFHIISFAFVCEVMLLLFTSLFSYFIMLSNKSITKLLFQPTKLNWLKPSLDKKNYYIKNIAQLVTSALIIYLFSLFYPSSNYYLFTLNAVMLLPLFVVTGYYLVKNSKAFIDKEALQGNFFFTRNHLKFIWDSKNIFLLYMVSILIFYSVRNTLFFNASYNEEKVKTGILILIIFVPLALSTVAIINKEIKPAPDYLKCFIVSLLLAVTLVSIVPVLTITSYGFHEEQKLQLQSLQIDLARQIQQRRQDVNPKFWRTKINTSLFNDAVFIDSLKFKKEKGIYLLPNDSLQTNIAYNPNSSRNLSFSPFYKIITQFLFLPPDHDEFYDNQTHNEYYYWKDTSVRITKKDALNKGSLSGKYDSLELCYNNATNSTDYKNKTSFSLLIATPHPYLFKNIWHNHLGLLMILSACIFIVLFYKLIYSASKRIFLTDFFEKAYETTKSETSADTKWLQEIYGWTNLDKANELLLLKKDEQFSFEQVRKKEDELIKKGEGLEEFIIQMHLNLMELFERIWEKCTSTEKFTLYDFAADGFTNYKKVLILHELYNKGLLIKEEKDENADNNTITFICLSFRNFLITKENEEEIKTLTTQTTRSSWGNFRTVFYIVLIAFAVFIFVTQQQASQRLITIVTSFGALLPAMLKLFDSSTSATKANTKN